MSKTKFKQTMRQIMIDWTNDYMSCSPRLRKLNSMLQETKSEKWKPKKIKPKIYEICDKHTRTVNSFIDENGRNHFMLMVDDLTKLFLKQAEEYREKLISLNK